MPSPLLKVLVCPLDWGLGHASRMIPVIGQLIKDGQNVFLAGGGRSGDLIKSAYPGLPFLALPGPEIRIGKGISSLIRLFMQVPVLIHSVFREHKMVKRLVALYDIDIIISDNRYGLFCRSAYTVFVTHQISPVLPFFFRWIEYPLYRLIRYIINLYDVCWIPDIEDSRHNLSGKLSHRFKLPLNALFIGTLSRFGNMKAIQTRPEERHYEVAVVLSGPEPQISVFENKVCRQLQELKSTVIVIRGMRGSENKLPGHNPKYAAFVSHIETGEFAKILCQAKFVLCRAGYSGIMDMMALGIQAILVPTPGQSEQEYLGAYLKERGWFQVIEEDDLDLPRLLADNPGPPTPYFNKGFQPGEEYLRDLYEKYSQNSKKAHYES